MEGTRSPGHGTAVEGAGASAGSSTAHDAVGKRTLTMGLDAGMGPNAAMGANAAMGPNTATG
ncbi:MAG: EF-hand domain-containing protein, partial [bacterium]